jgi:glycosyltransferase involved in cell wall biosynthesis
VIGEGPEFEKARATAAGAPNVTLLGYQSTDVLVDHMQRARAFVFAAEEDFGITPLEAQACGTPVIAYGKGGALETVIDEGPERTGLFFTEQTSASICDAVMRFENLSDVIAPSACRSNAEKFSPETFRRKLRDLVDEKVRLHLAQMASGRHVATHLEAAVDQ